MGNLNTETRILSRQLLEIELIASFFEAVHDFVLVKVFKIAP
jgi:hypothetical protein